MNRASSLVAVGYALTTMSASALAAQTRPDFSGVWRLDPTESRMIGAGGQSGVVPIGERQITWLVNHRDPAISVVVKVRDPRESHEFSFRCTTDGITCVNELAEIEELRRMSASWDGEVLVMVQQANSPHGDFEAEDRLSLSASGETLVFERVVRDAGRERPVRQVFRKLGPHPSQRVAAPEALPSVDLPSELDRVLRDYEQYWRDGDADALVALFTEDGLVSRRGGWNRGHENLREALQNTSSALQLRAVDYAIDERVGYIIGAYGYGTEPPVSDRGMFILALRKGPAARWLIAADLDGSMGQ